MGCDPAGTAGAAGLLFSWRRWLPLSSASAGAAQDCERHTLLVQLYSPAFVRKKSEWGRINYFPFLSGGADSGLCC